MLSIIASRLSPILIPLPCTLSTSSCDVIHEWLQRTGETRSLVILASDVVETERDDFRLGQGVSPRIHREDIPARTTARIDAFSFPMRRHGHACLQTTRIIDFWLHLPPESVPSPRSDVRRFRTRRFESIETVRQGRRRGCPSNLGSLPGSRSLPSTSSTHKTERARSTNSHGDPFLVPARPPMPSRSRSAQRIAPLPPSP